ncbi:MAG: response regulator transcription factor [Verrucomicrobiota bacterium]|jgi:DNA-binding NarL/FixJ family response regulator
MQVTLAIIDDDLQLLSLIGTHFEQCPGFAPPLLFNEGKTAIQKLARRKVDIALVDLLLPGDSGLRVIRRIAEKGLARQIIAFTNCDDDATIGEALASGATGYLLKGMPLADLAHGLLRCLRGEPVVSPPVLRSLIARYRKPKPPGLSEILSPAELRVIELGAAGHDCKTVASLLGLSVATVYVHNKRIAKKLGVPNRLAAIVKFKESGGSASANIAPDPATA